MMMARGGVRGIVIAAITAVATVVPGHGAVAAEEEVPAPVDDEVVATADPVSVTIAADPLVVPTGGSTHLTGAIDPAAEGETVEIVDAATGDVLDDAQTLADGSFATDLTPDRTRTLHARWGGLVSDPVTVEVEPSVRVSLGRVLLFGTALVRGRVEPVLPGTQVKVVLKRGSSTAGSRTVDVGGDGRFGVRFRIGRPGRYQAIARFEHPDLLPGSDRSAWRRTPLPRLSRGSRGTMVKLLERRLRTLKYYLTGVNARFDRRTGDAVLAFHKVQGMPRISRVTTATWRRLARPRTPGPRSRRPRFHIEIDRSRQVLLVIRRGKVAEIIHTSTGRFPGWTRDGVFRVHRKIAGYSPGRLYYPSYFDGNRAVHGWPSVPTYPASHGCARVPYWTAVHLHRMMGHGTVVRIYQ